MRGKGLPLYAAGGKRGGAWGSRAWATALPFLCALLIGALVFRGSGGRGRRPLQHHPPTRAALELDRGAPCLGADCGEPSSIIGGSAAAQGAALSTAGGTAAPADARPTGGSGSAVDSSGLASPDGFMPAGAAPAADTGERPKLFMFIGILSGRGYRHRRLAVREAWANRAQIPGQVVAKFILSEDERTPQVEKELEEFGDIVFVKEKTNYKSILYKTYYVLEYAATHYDAAFVLKTDDDAFINVPAMVAQLRALCEFPNCEGERIYMGKMAKHSEVLLQPGHKWNNAAFYNHTGLKTYPNYMMGGGYVIGGEVARVLVDIHARMKLKFTPIEDATLGFWLSTMDLRHIDHPRFLTWAAPCCFKAPMRKPGDRYITRFQLVDEIQEELCSTDPWLVMHKIDSPTKMRYMGQAVANCTAPEPWVLPFSIEQHFPPATQSYWAQQRQAWLAAHPESESSGRRRRGGKGDEEEEQEEEEVDSGDDRKR